MNTDRTPEVPAAPPAAEVWSPGTRHVGRRVLVYESTDSTSSRCAEFAADPANDGLVVLAGAQTAGRGQHGRTWLCRPGTGLLMSALLFPPPELRRPPVLTAWAAVAVCELIRDQAGLHPAIKWPNDVLVEGRKVCGILIEQSRGVVAGIGLNLNQSRQSFESEGLTEAGSLAMFTGREYAVRAVAAELLGRLDAEYTSLRNGDYSPLECRWKAALGLLGRPVLVEGHAREHRGTLLDVAFDAVVLEEAGGGPVILAPEMVRHIYPA